MEDRSIEVSASDTQAAIARGLALLNLSEQQVRIEIVDPGARGIFGIGAREATVRLTPIPQQVETVPVAVPEPAQEPTSSRPVRVPSAAPLPAEPAPAAADEQAEEPVHAQAYVLSQEQIAEISQQTLSELLAKMGMDCQVEMRPPELEEDPAPVTLDVQGSNVDVLIGRQGQVLDALQHITRLIVSREVEQWVNLVIDIDRYKQRRAKSLGQLAKRIAEHVANTKQPVALEPMPPNERRVIHIALKNHPAVTTQSVGRGDSRKVTIIPRR
jgi:spoIIIJ-associated protein